MGKLEKVESKKIGSDRKMFARALLWSGIALLIFLIAAVFIARPAAKKIHALTPNTSRSKLETGHRLVLA